MATRAIKNRITGENVSSYDALPAGTVLRDRYVVGKLLGSGGFGMTYLAYDKQQDCAVAVKEYYPAGTAVRTADNLTVEPLSSFRKEDFEKGLERFRNESEIILRFRQCSDILGVYDVFCQNGTAYYAMEYIGGVSLKEYVQNHGCLTEGQAVHGAEKLLSALSAIHGGGVLHRDISPDNIILCSGGGVKLIDFGSAREVCEQSMSVILKEGYAPLEQYQRRGARSGRTDLYSLAMCLYFGLIGQEPDNPIDRLDTDSAFRKGLEKVSPKLGAVIEKAAAVRENDRYETADEMLSAIKRTGIKPSPIYIAETIPPEVPVPQKISRWKKAAITAAAGGSAIIAAAAMLFRNTGDIMVRIGDKSFPVNSTVLDLPNRELTNAQIANLRHMKSLRSLNIAGNYITDLSCLEGLTELEYLCFSNNCIHDIEFARGMSKLKKIKGGNNFISDISPLADKKELTLAYFGDNLITDISPLKDCRKLVRVSFDEAKLQNIDALAGMDKLEMAGFSGCGLKSIEPLRGCVSLRLAYVGRNSLTDVSPLAGKPLEEFYVDNNRLSGHIDSFAGITVNGFISSERNGFSMDELEKIMDTVTGQFALYTDMDGKIITLGAEPGNAGAKPK